jgi:hypothetical protein
MYISVYEYIQYCEYWKGIFSWLSDLLCVCVCGDYSWCLMSAPTARQSDVFLAGEGITWNRAPLPNQT